MTGHLLGAAGAVEAIATVLAVRDGVVPGTRNVFNLDPEIKVDVATENRTVTLEAAVNDSFGFGGHNVALIFTADRSSRSAAARAWTRNQEPARDHRQNRIPPRRRVRAGSTRGSPRSGWSSCWTRDSLEPLHPTRHLGGAGRCAAGSTGARVVAYCTDGTRMGGAMGREGCRHIVDAIDTAVRERVPVIGLWHSGGARLAEGVASLDGVGHVFAAMVRASGRVPQISVVLGAGGRRRRLRAGADRHRDHVAGRPGVRHRTRTWSSR